MKKKRKSNAATDADRCDDITRECEEIIDALVTFRTATTKEEKRSAIEDALDAYHRASMDLDALSADNE